MEILVNEIDFFRSGDFSSEIIDGRKKGKINGWAD